MVKGNFNGKFISISWQLVAIQVLLNAVNIQLRAQQILEDLSTVNRRWETATKTSPHGCETYCQVLGSREAVSTADV